MKRLLFTVMVAALICGCAKEETSESAASIQNRVLDSWLTVNHYTNPKTSESGVVFLDETPGTGDVVNDTSFVFLNYYCTSLDGEIKSSNYKSLDEQLGTYATSTYYGPKVYRMGTNTLSTGIEEVLEGMKCGASFTVVLPATLAVMSDGLDYSSLGGTAVNAIYHVELVDVVEYITTYEIEQLEAYRDKYFPELDSLHYGVYLQKNISYPDRDTIANETAINVRYIGRMLDGTVFDTNIADTAKFYRMYDSSEDYDALEMTYYYDEDEMVSENSTVTGFSQAVHKLRRLGESCTVFFWSVAGYQDSGSGSIPRYAQLRFDIWVEEE